MKEAEIKKSVREGYAKIARQGGSCCNTEGADTESTTSCCSTDLAQKISSNVGYSEEELNAVPDGANLGLGCGNPVALASLKEGEIVLDLGSGAGFDCFLAANQVGADGRVIGVDMTAEMIEKARENAIKGGYNNVEFRLGEIENLPVADNSIDIIMSNCVINLSTDKKRVFQEAFRVLKPGGRLMVSDIVLTRELPDAIKESITAYIGCISGAWVKSDYLDAVKTAGFQDVGVVDETSFSLGDMANDPTAQAVMANLDITPEKALELAESIISMKVSGVKPI